MVQVGALVLAHLSAVELLVVLLITGLLTAAGSVLTGAGLAAGPAVAGFANVWPLALVFAGLGVVATGFSLRTSVVTGSVAGVLVAMYVVDLIGRLDPSLSGVRYVSVFKYYGNAIEDGIEPLGASRARASSSSPPRTRHCISSAVPSASAWPRCWPNAASRS